MDEPKEADALGRAVTVLRTVLGLSQEQVAQDGGISAGTVSDVEQGKSDPKRQTMEAIMTGLHVPLSTLARTVAFDRSVAADREALSVPGEAALLDPAWVLAGASEARQARATVELVAGELGARPPYKEVATAEAAETEALALWQRMAARSATERTALVEELEEFWSWPLSVLLCEKSAEAATVDAERAMELAELALAVARRVRAEEGFRHRVEGRAWAFFGNSRRVAGDLPGARKAFAEYHRLWRKSSDPGRLLDDLRPLDLEASLRREQRHLGKAHALLDRALKAQPSGPLTARLLLKKAKTYEEEKDYDRAIATLHQAAPYVEAAGDTRLLLVLRSNLLENLVQAGRFAEAEPLLPGVRALAREVARGLDSVRLRWIEGRIAAGTGRIEESISILAEVRAELVARGIAYDTALVTLELAAGLAELRRTAEVKALAEETARIFEAQGVPREKLAAVQLFIEAARNEALTAELARRLLLDLRDRA